MPHGMQCPTPALASGGRSRRCSGFTLEARAVVGLHPWALGWPAATTLSPHPQQLFSIHSLIRYSKLQPLLWCWHIPVFQHFPHILQERGWQIPSFGCCGCCSYRERSGQGWDVAQTFFLTQNHHVKAHFTWPALCSSMLNVMNMGLIIKPLVLDGIAILTAFEECAVGHEDQA